MNPYLCTRYSSALKDSTTEQLVVPTIVAKHLICDALGAGTLTPYDHLLRIAAKCSNVLLYPLKRKPLVMQTSVARALGQKVETLKEAPDANTVVEADRDNRLAHVLADLDNTGQVVLGISCAPSIQPASVYPNSMDWISKWQLKGSSVHTELVGDPLESRMV